MTDREKYLNVLEKMFYGMEKLESGVILPTSEVKTALAFAISSIKTDLKYDLLYEGEDELCNGDCDNCDFVDGDYCRFNEKSIPVNLHVTEIKKHQSDFSDLGGDNNVTSTDCISRQEAIDTIRQLYLDLASQKAVIDILKVLPSVTPQETRKGHWIVTAEEYYKAINEKGGGVNENTPYFMDDIACPECLAKFSVIDNETERFDYCPNCGADLKEETE